jgi:hypothetical protein
MFSENIQERLFIGISILSYVLYFIGLFGYSYDIPNFHAYIALYISIFLIYRFNPITDRKEFSSLDKRIAFSAGVFLLMSSTIGIFVSNYIQQVI